MKYIYFILLTFFVACKEEEKPQDKKEEEQVLPVQLLSDDEVQEIEALSEDKKTIANLDQSEKEQTNDLIDSLINKNKNKVVQILKSSGHNLTDEQFSKFANMIKTKIVGTTMTPKESLIVTSLFFIGMDMEQREIQDKNEILKILGLSSVLNQIKPNMTKDDAENIKITDEGLFKGMTILEIFQIFDKIDKKMDNIQINKSRERKSLVK